MQFEHRFAVEAPLADVVAFHRQSASMGAITPPPLVVQIQAAPAQLRDQDQMAFTLWFGPLPIRWRARIEQVTPISFVDRQLTGPFAHWMHLHTFFPVDDQTTLIVDRVEARLSDQPVWKLIGLGMWIGMPFLFAYRAWKTKQQLKRNA
jgi:ligand-binding SRPBCC domain-containing protein